MPGIGFGLWNSSGMVGSGYKSIYNVSALEPELVADFPENYFRLKGVRSTFDEVFTHTRTGPATLVDRDGVLKWTAHNFVKNSDDLGGSGWVLSPVSGGTRDGATLTLTGAENYVYFNHNGTIPELDDTAVTFAMEVVCDQTVSDVPIRVTDSLDGSQYEGLLDLVAGVSQTIRFTATFGSSSLEIGLDSRNAVIPGGSDQFGYAVTFSKVRVYRADLPMVNNPETGDDYVPTTTAARALPRLHNYVYDETRAVWKPHNLATFSEQLGSWGLYGASTATVTENQIAAPNGEMTADKIQFAGGAGGDYLYRSGIAAPAGSTVGCWMKTDSGTRSIVLRAWGSGATQFQAFTLTSEWQFFSFETTVSEGTGFGFDNRSAYGGSGTSGVVFAWGFHVYRSDLGGMLDNGTSFPTYNPTGATAIQPTLSSLSWVDQGLLIEGAATNLVSNSVNQISGFVLAGATRATGSLAPDGLNNWAIFTHDGIGPSDRAWSSYFTVLQGQTATGSVFIDTKQSSDGTVFSLYLGNASSHRIWLPLNVSGGVLTAGAGLSTSGPIGLIGHDIEDCGNGVYRVCITGNHGTLIGEEWVIGLWQATVAGSLAIWGAQAEISSMVTSFIPTYGATVTRAADDLRIRAGKAPWPTPVLIGPELVVNGSLSNASPSSPPSGWIDTGTAIYSYSSGALRIQRNGSDGIIKQTVSTKIGSIYEISLDVVLTNIQAARIGLNGGAAFASDTTNENTRLSLFFTSVASSTEVYIQAANSMIADITVKNFSVREVDPVSLPLVVSIALEGTITYSDINAFQTSKFYSALADGDNYIDAVLDTGSVAPQDKGRFFFRQEQSGALSQAMSNGQLILPGVNVPFSIAARHGSSIVNGAFDGITLTADNTPTAFPNITSADLIIGGQFNGNIKKLRIWAKDIGNTGIAKASI